MSTDFKLQDTKGTDWDALAAEYKKFSSSPATASIASLLARTNAVLPFAQATAILDNGCGPGPITSALLQTHGTELPPSCPILAADFSAGMVKQVEEARERALADGDEGWERVQTRVLDAMDLQGVADGSQSHVLAGWVYFMTADPSKCLSESRRVLAPGGVLACTAWEGSQWLDMMNTLKGVRPDVKMPELPRAWSDAGLLKGELEAAGFGEVSCERVAVKMQFERHETLVEWLLTKMPHVVAVTKDLSEEEMARYREAATALCKEYCPSAPGELSGWSLLAIGRKYCGMRDLRSSF